MRLLMRAAGALSLSLALAATASAQGLQFGVKAGWDRATMAVKDVSGAEARNDFAGGLFLTIPATPLVAVQPELLYVPKGAGATVQGGTGTVKLDYAEVPVLLRLNVPLENASVRPALFAGPFVGFKTTCKVEGTAGGRTASFNCDDPLFQGQMKVKSTDVGATFGGGLEFPLGGASALVEARYDLGLRTIDGSTDPADMKTRNILVFVGASFPLGGGKAATQRGR